MKSKHLGISLMLLIATMTCLCTTAFAEELSETEETESYIVVYSDAEKNEVSTMRRTLRKSAQAAQNQGKTLNFESLELTEEQAQELEKAEDVLFVEKDAVAEVFDDDALEFVEIVAETESNSVVQNNESAEENPRESAQEITWGISHIGADKTLETYSGRNIKVAVLDTGISPHEDLTLSGGISLVEGVESFADDNGHGTHIAGIIAATNNEIGIVGVAPNVELYAVKVLNSKGKGRYSDVISGINWAIENHIDIINLSLGGSDYSQALEQAVNNAVNSGIILVAAAGNTGENGIAYPAKFENVVSVGAIDENHEVAEFSSVGSELDLVAPGKYILSLSNDGESYVRMSGTSMAAAFATGSFAALKQALPEAETMDIIQKMYDTTTYISADFNSRGHGLINIAKAVGIEEISEEPDPDDDDWISEAEMFEFDVTLLGYKDKLRSYEKTLIDSGNYTLAKEIAAQANNIIAKDRELHALPPYLRAKNNDEWQSRDIEINDYYAQKTDEFEALEDEYKNLIGALERRFADDELSTSPIVVESLGQVSAFATASNQADISLKQGSAVVLRFVPSGSEKYRFITSAFGETGGDNDTYIAIFTDSKCTNRVAYADDGAENGNFTMLECELSAQTPYYVRIGNSDSGSGILHARFQYVRSASVPTAKQLSLNSRATASVKKNSYLVCEFAPAKTAVYTIRTGAYSNVPYDTKIEIYSNACLTDKLTECDDSANGLLAEAGMKMTAGKSYFVKVSGYNGQAAKFTLQAVRSELPVQTISLNTAVRTQTEQGETVAFKFVPTESGTYTIETSEYSGESDTCLTLYRGEKMTHKTAYDDNSGENVFSRIDVNLRAGEIYMIKFSGYSLNAADAMLKITKIEEEAQEQNDGEETPIENENGGDEE